MKDRLPKGALGGQAVMEGVMMKGPDGYSVAVRRPDQKIKVSWKPYSSIGDRYKICRLPFIRGIVNFLEAVTVGMKTLMYSSSILEEDEETKADQLIRSVFKEKADQVIVALTVTCSILLAMAIFVFLPAFLAELLGKWVTSHIWITIIEGILRIGIFLGYIALLSQMEDIKRVFMYHGAEHKTINCYEAGEELTPEKVAGYSRYHKRCGTSFMFTVVIISIVVFLFITSEQFWIRMLLRLVLIPVIAGISYEFIRAAGRHDGGIFDLLSRPGILVQKLTTKEPDEKMLQVAIVSVEAVLYGQEYADAVNEAQGI